MTGPRAGGGRSTVRRLAGHRDQPAVSSLYLDVDGAHRPVPGGVDRAFEQLADELRRRARARAGARRGEPGANGGDPVVRSVEGDIERMRSWLRSSLDRSSTRGVALFSCAAQGWFEAVPLPVPLRDEAAVGDGPRIRQLAALWLRPGTVLAAMLDRAHLRLIRVGGRQAEELPGLFDPPERAVDTAAELGSWEHREAEAARAHVRRAAAMVEEALAAESTVGLVLGGPAESATALERALSPAARGMLVGRVGVRVSAPADEVAASVRAVAEVAERRREAALVEDLRQRAAAGNGGVVGLEPTLAALAARRVATLLVRDGFAAPGARCPACGHLGADLRHCPLCGAVNLGVDDVVELAIEEAVVQGAEVEFCRDTELDRFGSIAALGRY